MSRNFFTQWMIACVSAMFVLPFVWARHTLPIPSFYGEGFAALLILAACMFGILLFFYRPDADKSIFLPFISFLFLPLIAIVCLQSVTGKLTDPYGALFPVLIMLCATASVILGAVARSLGMEKFLCWICMACIAGGLFNVQAQLLQFFGTGDFSLMWVSHASNSYYGNLAQRNHLATYLSWSLIAVFYLYSKQYFRGCVAVFLTVVFLVGVTLTASRMSWLQTSWIAVSGGYLVWKMQPAQRPVWWQLIFALPFAYLIVTLIFPYIPHEWNVNAGPTALIRIQAETFDGNRWLLYSQAWEIFKNNPIIGIGPGEFSFHQFLLMDHYNKTLFATSAHNLILDLLAVTGLVGTLCVGWFLVAWFLRLRKTAPSLETVCILLMLAVFGIHSLLEFPEWYGFFLLPISFFLGCLDTRFIKLKGSVSLSAFAGASVVLGFVFCVTLFFHYTKLESLYAKSYYYNQKASPADAATMSELEAYQRSSFFKAPADFLVSWNLRLSDADLEKKLAMSERAMRYQPDANIIYRHIVLLGFAGQQERALFYLIRLKNTYPADYANISKALSDLALAQPGIFGNILAEANRRGLIKAHQ